MAGGSESSGLRERKKRETREALVRAGIELFAERGVKGTRVADIAAAANVSTRTFFSYFERKEDVLFEEQRAGAQALRVALETRRDDLLTVDVLESMLVVGMEALPAEVLRLRRLRYAVVAAEPRLQGPDHAEFAEAIRAPLSAAFARDLRRATVGEVEPSARLLAGLTIGALMEFVYIVRESVVSGRRTEDAPRLMAVGEVLLRSVRGAFVEVCAARDSTVPGAAPATAGAG
jgi:AcrR family transcriptional regulator